MLHPYQLGASLYMPATRQDIWHVISREKLTNIDSIIICLEDSVHENEVSFAFKNLTSLLSIWQKNRESTDATSNDTKSTDFKSTDLSHRPLVFIRPRNTDMLQELSDLPTIDCVDGFVLPKVDLTSLEAWKIACENLSADKLLMPTLETAHVFDSNHNYKLSKILSTTFKQPIFAIRIGGNDLLSCLRLRRPRSMTIYDTPIGAVINQLLGCFVSQGYYLTAPVFEYFDETDIFQQEIEKDVLFGFVGKTIIHPNQIEQVKRGFCVSATELAEAEAILDLEAPAVFKQDNAMLEPATHLNWAQNILMRKAAFGCR